MTLYNDCAIIDIPIGVDGVRGAVVYGVEGLESMGDLDGSDCIGTCSCFTMMEAAGAGDAEEFVALELFLFCLQAARFSLALWTHFARSSGLRILHCFMMYFTRSCHVGYFSLKSLW